MTKSAITYEDFIAYAEWWWDSSAILADDRWNANVAGKMGYELSLLMNNEARSYYVLFKAELFKDRQEEQQS